MSRELCRQLLPERRTSLGHADEPQSERHLAGGDERIEMAHLFGRQRPMSCVPPNERFLETRVVGPVAQLPQRHRHVVDPVAEAAVVEVDQARLLPVEQHVVEVGVGVDEAERIGTVS